MYASPAARAIDPRLRALLELAGVAAVLWGALSLMTVDQAVGGGWGPKLFVVGRMLVLLLLCTWLLRAGGERWADMGLRRPPRWWTVPLLVVVGFAAFLVVAMSMHPMLAALGLDPPRHHDAALRGDLLEYLFWAVPVTWGTAAFGEEMLLRGFVLDRIGKLIGSNGSPAMLAAAVLQGALFGALHVHQGLGGIIVTGMLGVMFGLLWLLGGRNLWACIIVHGLINTIAHYESYSAAAG